ncbi:MAG: DUF2497 domain-containing protein [Rhizobiales bacterium]|nr:DUF2497 domain-containing protein [Hyphomicrobiales bacterium]
MDEILASIRRIIQDEDVRKSGVRASALAASEEADEPKPAGKVSRLFAEDVEDAVAEDVVPEVKPPPAAGDDNVVELAIAEAMKAARAEMTGGQKAADAPAAPVEAASVRRVEARPVAPAPRPVPPVSRPAAPTAPVAAPLLSPRADAAVAGSFQQLAGKMLAGGARPVDEVVEELLRPMLRNWLDTNLPPLVERLVREEIERVSRGRG